MASGKCGPGWRPLGGGGGKAAVGCGRIPPDVLVAVRVFDPGAESVSKRTTAKTIDTSAAAIVINHADLRLICAILRGARQARG